MNKKITELSTVHKVTNVGFTQVFFKKQTILSTNLEEYQNSILYIFQVRII